MTTLKAPPSVTAAQFAQYLSAAGTGGTVVMEGDYTFSESVEIDAAISIVASGKATITQTGTPKKTFNVTGNDVVVSGVQFVGKGEEDPWSSSSYNGVAGVFMNAVNNCSIVNCKFTNHAGPDVVAYGACNNLTVANNVMIGMGSGRIVSGDNGVDGGFVTGGSTAECHNITVTQNQITDHALGIICSYDPNSTNVQIVGNAIRECHGQTGIYVANCGQLRVSSNDINNAAHNGIKVQQQQTADTDLPILISDNNISLCGQNGIGVTSSTAYFYNDVSVSGNIISGCTQEGINTDNVKNFHIVGNKIRNCDRYGLYFTDSGGVATGNHISKTGACAVYGATPTEVIKLGEMEIVDCPLNTGASTNFAYTCVMYLGDEASPDQGYYYLGNITMRFENESAKTGTGALAYAIRDHSNSRLVQVGPVYNNSGVSNLLSGTLTAPTTTIS